MSQKESIHYVNNAEFSAAVVEYVENLNNARKTGNFLRSELVRKNGRSSGAQDATARSGRAGYR